MKPTRTEAVAIVGMACRFPAAPSLADFWALLSQGTDGIGLVPKQRWDVEAMFDQDAKAPGKVNTRFGGFVGGIDRFDAAFFGISPREATQMDPQQRILLELAYEAIEDAGIAPATLAGTNTAVYVGAMTNDYLQHQLADAYRRVDVHSGSGSGLCMLANRLSYQFDLRGPSAAVDSACSSSLVAAFHACQSLWTGQSRVALAAGVNLMLDPGFSVFYAKGGLSAPDGRCKTFSAAADGIGRGEGAGVVVLKRLQDALADGDSVYAVIRGGAVNHDGRSNGLTQPNRWAQEQLLHLAFDHAGVDPGELEYVELHGTGTLIGDPIEANALAAALVERGERNVPCLVGSVKTNIGHLEAAAGIAGLIKLALSIFHGEIPPSLWFDAPNPHIAFETMPIRVNTHRRPWLSRDGRRVGGISSFGLGGTNAHLVLESAPPVDAESNRPPATADHWLFLSARSEAALRALVARYIEFLAITPESDLPGVCSTALKRKGVHDFRLSVIGGDKASLSERLRTFLAGTDSPLIVHGRFLRSRRRVLLAVPEHRRVDGRRLSRWLAAAPVARETWNACRALLRDCSNVILPSVGALSAHPEVIEGDPDFRAWHFASQYALLKQAITSVRTIETIVADGLGQLAAFCAADALPLGVAIRWIEAGLSHEFAEREVPTPPHYSIDCDCVSGRNPSLIAVDWSAPSRPWHERLDRSVEREEADVLSFNPDGIDRFDRSPGPGVASPLALGEPDSFHSLLAQLSLYHQLEWSTCANDNGFIRLPPYPWQRESFWLPRNAIGNDSAFAGIAAAPIRTPSDLGASCSVDRAAGASYKAPAALEQEAPLISMETKEPVRAPRPEHTLLGRRTDTPTPSWESRLNAGLLPYLPDHRVQGLMVLPGAAYAELGLAVHHQISAQAQGVLENLEFHKALVIEEQCEPLLRVTYDEDSRDYVVYSQRRERAAWEMHARGRLSLLPPAQPGRVCLEEIQQRCTEFSDAETHYRDMAGRGFQYGPYFRAVRRLWLDPDGNEVLAWIAGDERLAHGEHRHRLHPTVFDASLQAVLTPLRAQGDMELYIPVGIRQMKLHKAPGHGFWCHGRLKRESPGVIEGEVILFDEEGEVIAEARGVRAQALTQKDPDELKDIDQWLYEFAWEAAARETAPRPAGRWLLFMDRGGAGERLAERLAAAGAGEIVQVLPAETFEQPGPGRFLVAAESKADMLRLLNEAAASLAGIVYLWGLDTPEGEDGLADASSRTIAVVHLIQALTQERSSNLPHLVVVTRGAQSVRHGEPVETVAQAPLIGLVRVALNEYPELRLRVIDIDRDVGTLSHLAEEILSGNREDEIALRGAGRYVQRMLRKRVRDLDQEAGKPAQPPVAPGTARPETVHPAADLGARGRARREPGPGEVEVALQLATLGSSAGGATESGGVLGGLGVVARAGKSLRHLEPDDAVLVHLQGPLGRRLTVPGTDVLALSKRDAKVIKANAAHLPAFLCAYYALERVARLQRGEKVLIQQASLPLGLAAIQVARWLGASVYAVVAGEEQADYLRSLGVDRVFDGRSLDFADGIMECTGGHGIDVALNVSSGEIAGKTFALLAPFGRFVDLSRREDVHRAVAGSRQSNRTVTALDAHQLMVERPELFGQVLAQVCKRFRARDFAAIPARVFPAAEAAAAIDASNAPGRVGAVAVCFDPDPEALLPAGPFHPKGTYLVTGGFGGFGLEIAAWMVGQGARNLVLAGRRGAATPEAKQAVDRLRRHGARVLPVAADISKEPDVERLLARIAKEMPPLKGVFHAAAVLEDSPIDQVDRAQIEHVMSAKALGAWHLHRHTQGSALDYFVLFSSIASMVGGPGQASYAMSCACLDSLAHYRRARNLAATSIHWGALGQVGMAARYTDAEKYLSRSGVGSFTPAQAVKLLGRVMSWNPVELGVASMDWKLWGGAYPAWTASPKYGALVVDEEGADMQPANQALLRQLSELDPEKREGVIADALTALLAETMQLAPEKIDRKLSLLSIGIDSLMAMELQASVEKKLAVKISMLELMKGNSLAQLAHHVALTMSIPRADAPAARDGDSSESCLPEPRMRREFHLEDAEQIMAQLGDLTDDEVDRLIAQLVPKEGVEV